MPVFHYQHSQLIDRVEISSHNGIACATIVPVAQATADQLDQLRQQLGAKKFSTLMDTVDGQAVIEVRGLKDADKLLACLNRLDQTKTGVEKKELPGDHKQLSFRERVRGSALFLSAIFYDLGNAAFFVSGIQRGKHNKNGKMTPHDKSEMMIGGAFSVGDVLMTAYGGHRGDEELLAAEQGLKRHLHQKGIAIPKGDELNPDTLYQSGALKATDRWLRHHITQIKCMSEFAGGLFTIHSGMKPGNINRSKVAAGLLISTGWLATCLLDKPPGHHIFDGDQPPPDDIMGIMTNNPRGFIARPAAIGNNLANLWGALGPGGERSRFRHEVLDAQKQLQLHHTPANLSQLAYAKTKQHDYAWNVVSACSFLVANFLFGVSGSKRPRETEDDKTMMNDLVLLSANVLAKQPESARQTIIADTAEYVSKLSHVSLAPKEIEAAISAKIGNLQHSRWASRVQAGTESQAALS